MQISSISRLSETSAVPLLQAVIIPRAHTITASKKSFFILLCFYDYRISHSRTSGGMTSELLVLRR